MATRILEKFRGTRRIELYAVIVVLSALALLGLRGITPSASPQKTQLEQRLETILSRIDGTGRVSVMVSEDVGGSATGVMVVADGLSDLSTYLRIQRAVSTLLDIETSRISIIGRDGTFGGGT